MKEEGQAAGKETKIELMKLDLSSLQSTKQFIEDFKQKNLPLHLLICNAGIAGVPHGEFVHICDISKHKLNKSAATPLVKRIGRQR